MSAALLDTQALLWFIDANPRLSATASAKISEPGIELFFSYASVWELAIKYGIGKLQLPDLPEPFLLGIFKSTGFGCCPSRSAPSFWPARCPSIIKIRSID